MADDRELLSAWRGGDERSGRALIERHYDAVARFFANKDRTHAADMIQLTFLKMLESRARVPDEVNVRAYMLGIARHVLYDHYRAQQQDGARLDFTERSIADLNPTPTSVIARERQTRLLLLGLRQIPLESQTILELYYWEELTAREVAEILQVPEGTVRTRIRRARQLLEQALARIADSPAVLESTLSGLEGWALRLREELSRT